MFLKLRLSRFDRKYETASPLKAGALWGYELIARFPAARLSALATGYRRMMSQGDPPDDDQDDGVGYRRPPRTTRFTKGQSGNPAGRTRGRRREAPYEAVLGQMVTIREGGAPRRVTAAEAFLLQLAKRGLEGDGPAAIIYEVAQQEQIGLFSRFALMRKSIDAGVPTSALVSWDGLHNTVEGYDCIGRALARAVSSSVH
jgi:hypothetical protein